MMIEEEKLTANDKFLNKAMNKEILNKKKDNKTLTIDPSTSGFF
jgi:hypothetical protein